MYRILLVDDDSHIQAANEAFLKKNGYQIYRAENGADALAIASTAALDAVVLDVYMPGMDGVSVCRRLRELSGVPVIFLSAYAGVKIAGRIGIDIDAVLMRFTTAGTGEIVAASAVVCCVLAVISYNISLGIMKKKQF